MPFSEQPLVVAPWWCAPHSGPRRPSSQRKDGPKRAWNRRSRRQSHDTSPRYTKYKQAQDHPTQRTKKSPAYYRDIVPRASPLWASSQGKDCNNWVRKLPCPLETGRELPRGQHRARGASKGAKGGRQRKRPRPTCRRNGRGRDSTRLRVLFGRWPRCVCRAQAAPRLVAFGWDQDDAKRKT